MRKEIRVLIAGRSPVIRLGLVQTLARETGASGFLRSSESMECLLPAIRKVLSGGVYISHGLSREVLEGTEENGSRRCNGVDRLSEREFQIFELLGNGYDVNKIGEKLHIGTKKVEIHRRELILKLGISETKELTRRAITYVVQTHRLVSNA